MFNKIVDLLSRPEVQTMVAGIIAMVFGFIKKQQWTQKWKLGVALNAFEAGVMDSYETYVRAIKISREDGKLTDEERKEARKRAIDVAVALARSEGLDLVKFYGKEYIPVIIEKFVMKNKTAAGLAKPFLDPELPL